LGLLLLTGCRGQLIVTCGDDSACLSSGARGTCTKGGTASYCAFADTSCPSGRKWDPTAGDGLGGTCVGGGGGDGGIGDLAMPPDMGMPLWQALNSGTTAWLFAVGGVPGKPDVWAGGQLGKSVLYSGDDGNKWDLVGLPISMMSVNGIAAVSAKEVYAVADSGIIYIYDGAAWAESPSPTTENLNGVWCEPGGTCFAVGDSGTILRRTPATGWLAQMAPGACVDTLHGVFGRSPTEAIAVGYNGVICGTIDGTNWVNVHTDLGTNLSSVWGDASGIFVASDKGYVLRSTDGIMWKQDQLPEVLDLWGTWGSSSTDVYVVGGPPSRIYHFDGTGWKQQGVPVMGEELSAIWGADGSDIFVVGHNGTILHGPP
jgi:hypothetical protein